jgi:hypothetical protein
LPFNDEISPKESNKDTHNALSLNIDSIPSRVTMISTYPLTMTRLTREHKYLRSHTPVTTITGKLQLNSNHPSHPKKQYMQYV